MSRCGVLFLLVSIMAHSQVHWAQGVDNSCPEGWKEVAQGFLSDKLNGDIVAAAEYVHPDNREPWMKWTSWDMERTERRILGFSEEIQERAQKEKTIAKQRLKVSVFSCTAISEEEGRYRIKVDPDGRSYQFISLAQKDDAWWVHNNLCALTSEQRRAFTAYTQALDAGSWEEAEAWVARFVLPRFTSYRAEASAFLSEGGAFVEAHQRRVEARAAEWDSMFLRVEMESDEIIIVHAEFPTAEGVSSEMVKVDGTWRILFR